MQIDVLKIADLAVTCNLQTPDRDVRIIMSKSDYAALINDGFFIRDGLKPDSAGVLNTTKDYTIVK